MPKKQIIQITDMHLFEQQHETLLGVNTWDSFTAVLEMIQSRFPNPDLIFLTGDLAQDEMEETYRRLIQALQPFDCPKYGIPGNHDDERYMRAIFHELHLQDNRHVILDHWNLILLNTQKPRAVEGYLSVEQLDFLANALGMYPEHHALIFMHHPPVAINSAWIDRLMLSNHTEFWKTIAPFKHIKGIFCGHVHQSAEIEHHRIPVYTTPSTCFQFTALSQQFSVSHEMPGFRVIELDAECFTTAIYRITDYKLNIDIHSRGY